MLAQFVGFLSCSVCFLIIGSVVRKSAGWNVSSFHDFLIGLALSNAVFTLISLGYPINNTVVLLFTLLVGGLFLVNFTYERVYFRQLLDQFILYVKKNSVLFGLLTLFMAITFFQSLYSPSLHYDSGLYHVPAIQWTATYKTIRGLVHLNNFLGYNFNIFSLDAAFYNLFQQPIYPVNFTVTCFFSFWLFSKISYSLSSNQYVLVTAYVLVFYYLIQNFWPHVSTPSVDTLVFILSFIILSSAADLRKNRDAAFSIVVLSVYTITVKLSAVPVLLIALYFICTNYYWKDKKQAVLTLLMSGFMLIPWLVKNVLLTGWVLFPFPEIDLFSFDWKLPVQDVVQLKEDIRKFYIPDANPRNSVAQSWLLNQSGIDLFIIAISIVTLLILLFRLLTKKTTLSGEYAAAISVSVLGVLFMSLYSPSLRYGVAFFLGIIILSIQSFTYQDTISKYGFYLAVIFVVGAFLSENWFHPWHFIKHIAQRFLLPYPLVLSEKKEFAYFLIDQKTKCYYPVESNQCFDHGLPCASRRVDGLHLRGNGIEQGFYRDAR